MKLSNRSLKLLDLYWMSDLQVSDDDVVQALVNITIEENQTNLITKTKLWQL